MKASYILCLGALLAGLMMPEAVKALDVGDPDDFNSFVVHGFASQGFILTTGNDYLVKKSTRGSFQFSELGLNITKQLTDDLRFGMQLFAQDFGAVGNYNVRADWFYLDYRWRDWLGFRAGRMKLPIGLMNEFNDVDAARNAILMPQSIYPSQARQLLYAQTGVELYGFQRLGNVGALNYQGYVGRIYLSEADLRPADANYRLSPNVPWVTGGRAIWETPIDGLRFAQSIEVLKLNVDAFGTTPMGMNIHEWVTNRSNMYVTSVEWMVNSLALRAEYSRSIARQDSNDPVSAAVGGRSDRMYAQAIYRVNDWFQPGVYYALSFPNIKERNTTTGVQHDLSTTLRFDVNDYFIVKAEGHLMQGTAGLQSPLQIGATPTGSANTWGVFLLKTTAYF